MNGKELHMKKDNLILLAIVIGAIVMAGCSKRNTVNTKNSIENNTVETEEVQVVDDNTLGKVLSSNSDVITYKSQCTALSNYTDLLRYPDNYVNHDISIHVQVKQLMEDGQVLRVSDDANNDGFYMDNEYLIIDARGFDITKILEGDIIVAYGVYTGTEAVTRAINDVQDEIPCLEMQVADIEGVEQKGITDIDTSFWLGNYCRNGDSNDCGVYIYDANSSYIAFSIGDGQDFGEREIIADLDASGYTATYTDDYHSYSLIYKSEEQIINVKMEIFDKSIYPIDASGSYSILDENYEIDTGEYIFSDSNQLEIYENELVDLSDWELRLARNEILARRGRKFSDQELQKYFDSCSWYSGTIEPEDFDESVLSDIENSNINIIKNEENSRNQ